MRRWLAVLLGFVPTAGMAAGMAQDGASNAAGDGFFYAPLASEHGTVAALQMADVATATYVDGPYIVNRDYLLSYPNNLWRIATGPTRYDRDDWVRVAFVLGTTGALFALDQPIHDFWQGDVRSGLTDDLADGFATISDGRPFLLQSAGLYVVGEALGSKRESATALLSFESRILTAGLISGLKYVTGRHRPTAVNGPFNFEGPGKADFNASFPSGHAGDAFALAAVLDDIYSRDYPWAPYVAYPAAAAVGLARINEGRHWASDILLGGALGFFVGKMVTRYNPFLRENDLSIRPLTRTGYRGVSLAVRF